MRAAQILWGRHKINSKGDRGALQGLPFPYEIINKTPWKLPTNLGARQAFPEGLINFLEINPFVAIVNLVPSSEQKMDFAVYV